MSAPTRRILLVEDEKSIRDAVTAYLEREGYWVTPAEDGAIALDQFDRDGGSGLGSDYSNDQPWKAGASAKIAP